MKLEILQNDQWINVLVVDAKTFPTIKILDDSQHSGHLALSQFNNRIASLRIDGVEGRYGIDFDGSLFLERGKVGCCYLNICKAVKIPFGTKVYLVA